MLSLGKRKESIHKALPYHVTSIPTELWCCAANMAIPSNSELRRAVSLWELCLLCKCAARPRRRQLSPDTSGACSSFDSLSMPNKTTTAKTLTFCPDLTLTKNAQAFKNDTYVSLEVQGGRGDIWVPLRGS